MGGFTGIGAGWVCWRPEAIVKGPLRKCEGTAECFFIQKPRGPGPKVFPVANVSSTLY